MKHFVLLFFFLSLVWKPYLSYILVDKLSRTVSGGDFHHYTLSFNQVILLCLVTDNGDADMFVARSSVTEKPTSDQYEFSSVSTGVDVIAVPYEGESSISVGIQGHVRYDESSYRLLVLTLSESEARQYQVWEVDPETSRPMLMIDIDPLWLANEPKLCRMLSKLQYSDDVLGNLEGPEDGVTLSEAVTTIKEWLIWIALLLLKIIVEVLA